MCLRDMLYCTLCPACKRFPAETPAKMQNLFVPDKADEESRGHEPLKQVADWQIADADLTSKHSRYGSIRNGKGKKKQRHRLVELAPDANHLPTT